MSWNPSAMAIIVTRDPVPMSPVRMDPSPISIVVACDPNPSARRAGVNLNCIEHRQNGKTHCEQEFLHSVLLLWLGVFLITKMS